MGEPDPVSWIRELGKDQPWDYALVAAFLRAYRRSSPRRQAAAATALPGLAGEAYVWELLRARARRN